MEAVWMGQLGLFTWETTWETGYTDTHRYTALPKMKKAPRLTCRTLKIPSVAFSFHFNFFSFSIFVSASPPPDSPPLILTNNPHPHPHYTVYSWFALWPSEWGRQLLLSWWQRGFPTQLLLLLRLNQNTSVLLPVMSWPRKYSKLLPWETPYQEVQTVFFPSIVTAEPLARVCELFWLGFRTLLVEMANVNPLNSNNGV